MAVAQERLAAALADRYRIERDVAIKVLKPELGAERFLNEIRTTLCGGRDIARSVPDLAGGEILRWSPDGQALWVWTKVGDQDHVDAVEVATGRRTPLLRLEAPEGVPGFQVIAPTTGSR
jgi:hypothetical protein